METLTHILGFGFSIFSGLIMYEAANEENWVKLIAGIVWIILAFSLIK